jgi:type VI secretion system secreted protein VgrG
VSDLQVTNGLVYAGGAIPQTAQGDATTAYNTLAGLTSTSTSLTGQDLGGLTLGAGVYSFATSAQLTGALTLDFTGNNQTIVFDIGSTLTTASASSVVLEGWNSTDSVYWVVGSSATLGTTTSFEGNIIAQASDTLNTGATDGCGSVIALTGAVTLDDNTISTGCNIATTTTVTQGGLGPGTVVPEGGSPILYLSFFLLPFGAMRAFRFRRSS